MATAKQTAARLVLAGVPRIGYDVHLSPFPGALYSWLQFMGDPADYDYLMGVTGACFRRLWNRDDGGNVDLMYLAPEPYAPRCGRWAIPGGGAQHTTAPASLAAVREEVAAGRPLLVFAHRPPEAGLVTGYDAGGEVLIGWSYFQDMPDQAGRAGRSPATASRAGAWRKRATGASRPLIIGEKGPRPDARKVFLSSLPSGPSTWRARTPVRPARAWGITPPAWPPTRPGRRGWRPTRTIRRATPRCWPRGTMVHGDQAVMLEERHNAAAYLRAGLALLPEAGEALAAAAP